MKKCVLALLIAAILLAQSTEAVAFWVWSPKTNKFTDPKNTPLDNPDRQFQWAMKFFEGKDYKRAAEEFTSLTKTFKDSSLAPEAQYYIGRSHEAAGRLFPAFTAYQKTIDVYPFTKRTDEIIERQFDIGNMFFEKHRGTLMGKEIMTDLTRAVEVFNKVRDNSPFGEYADRAQYMIGESYTKSEQFGEAAEAFQKLVDEHPESSLMDRARYEIARTTYLASLKPDYDQELTEEAIQEFKEVAMDSSTVIISEQAENAIAVLENKKAESLFNTAKFYQSQKHYKSAAIYYREILDKYPESASGELALSSLRQIGRFLEK